MALPSLFVVRIFSIKLFCIVIGTALIFNIYKLTITVDSLLFVDIIAKGFFCIKSETAIALQDRVEIVITEITRFTKFNFCLVITKDSDIQCQ